MNKSLSIALLSAVAIPSYAALGPAGISGEISLNAGYTSSDSNFNTEGEATITSRDQSGSSESGSFVGPLGNLAYTFGSQQQQQLYMGTTREDIAVGTLAFQFGYKYQIPGGTIIDVAYLPTVMAAKSWTNPYELNTARQETDEDGNAYRLTLDRIAGTPFTLDFAYGTKDVENDELVGTELARDGKSYYLKAQYRQMLSRTSFVLPALKYIKHEADGNANSYDSYAFELSYFTFLNKHTFGLTGSYTVSDYEGENSVFGNQIRSDDKLGLFAVYEYDKLMNWENWSLISLAGYSSSDSNITFYDETEYFMSLGINYKF